VRYKTGEASIRGGNLIKSSLHPSTATIDFGLSGAGMALATAVDRLFERFWYHHKSLGTT